MHEVSKIELTEISAIFPEGMITRVIFENGRKGALLLPVEGGVVSLAEMDTFKAGDPVLIALNPAEEVVLIQKINEANDGTEDYISNIYEQENNYE